MVIRWVWGIFTHFIHLVMCYLPWQGCADTYISLLYSRQTPDIDLAALRYYLLFSLLSPGACVLHLFPSHIRLVFLSECATNLLPYIFILGEGEKERKKRGKVARWMCVFVHVCVSFTVFCLFIRPHYHFLSYSHIHIHHSSHSCLFSFSFFSFHLFVFASELRTAQMLARFFHFGSAKLAIW